MFEIYLRHRFRDWDVVVNCTGFGAKRLCGDRMMTANRGQVLKVDAPWVKVEDQTMT